MTGCLDLCLALAGLLCMCRCRWRRCCCRWDCSAEVASEAVGETGGLASNSTYEVHENFMSFRCVMPGVMLCSWKLVEAGTCVPRFADGSTHQTFDAPSLTSRQLSGLSLVAVTPDTQSPTPQIFLEQNAHYADPFVLRSEYLHLTVASLGHSLLLKRSVCEFWLHVASSVGKLRTFTGVAPTANMAMPMPAQGYGQTMPQVGNTHHDNSLHTGHFGPHHVYQ